MSIPGVKDPEVYIPGGYVPVKDPHSPHLTALAEWAVAEHNKEKGTHLRFITTLHCESQIVEGVNYRFVLMAKEENDYESGNYMTVVWEKDWENFKELIYFKRLILAE